MNSDNNKNNQDLTEMPKRPMSHRVIAWVGIILLVSMYTITFISAISGGGSTSALFMMSLGATILIPCVLWGYMCLWRWSVNKSRKKIMQSQVSGTKGTEDGTEQKSDEALRGAADKAKSPHE